LPAAGLDATTGLEAVNSGLTSTLGAATGLITSGLLSALVEVVKFLPATGSFSTLDILAASLLAAEDTPGLAPALLPPWPPLPKCLWMIAISLSSTLLKLPFLILFLANTSTTSLALMPNSFATSKILLPIQPPPNNPAPSIFSPQPLSFF
jgi:hypothetical protein